MVAMLDVHPNCGDERIFVRAVTLAVQPWREATLQ